MNKKKEVGWLIQGINSQVLSVSILLVKEVLRPVGC